MKLLTVSCDNPSAFGISLSVLACLYVLIVRWGQRVYDQSTRDMRSGIVQKP